MEVKRIEWVRGSRQSLQQFPEESKNIAGNQLWLVQQGRQPDNWKPMKEIGPGAFEIRIHKPHEHRVICVSKFPEAIYVLHCFEKKRQKT
jgi:phage-related protein